MSQKIINDIKFGFKDVLIKPKRSSLSSRSQVDLKRTFSFKNSPKTWTGIPIVSANMDTTGTFEVAIELAKNDMLTAIHKHYSIDEWDTFLYSLSDEKRKKIYKHIMVSSGTSEKDFEKLKIIMSKHSIDFICLDIANGYSEHFSKFVKKVRKEFEDKIIFAGNVVTEDMTHQLLLDGADVIKIGIGPGSVCTTRKQTGVGYPQLSAILECSDAAHGLNGAICSDGGCACPGDVAKAFGGDADFVMLGGMLAGHDESGGEIIEIEGQKFVEFYGMSSDAAMSKHSGGLAEYRSSEGKRVIIPYRGPIEKTIFDLLGGLRSTCTYIGASKMKELGKCTTFIRVQEQLNETFGKS
jgi:GMP reductase